MDFVVVDVETANEHPASICQVGVATFRGGKLEDVWGTLVNPRDSFSPFNQRIHGISPEHVCHSPTWPHLQPQLHLLLSGRTVASHTEFDRTAMDYANRRHNLNSIQSMAWVDTCNIARAVWPNYPNHKLTSLARTLDIPYQAHDAKEDARCAGEILLRAAKVTGLGIRAILQADPARLCVMASRFKKRRLDI
jgi:DNA polymerase-3 subunit epsilon